MRDVSGILPSGSSVDCQKACPDVAERISAVKPKVWRTGMNPSMLVIGPFCSVEVILPFCRVISVLTCPTPLFWGCDADFEDGFN
jgi:hypothetical protein